MSGSFSLLSALGNGSTRIAAHHRFSVAAYQAGSILVLWDYARADGEARKFVLMQPNQRCEWLFFPRDGQQLLGFWASEGGRPTVTVWKTADGGKLMEQRLSDQVGPTALLADFNVENSQFVVVAGTATPTASVALWNSQALRVTVVSHGHVSSQEPPLGVRLLGDGRHFVLAEAAGLQFWSYAEQAPHPVLKVDLTRRIRAFEVSDNLVYLMPEQGQLQVMNCEGQREAASVAPPQGAAFTAVAVRGGLLCLGCDDGSLCTYRLPRLELWMRIPVPHEVGHGGHPAGREVISVTLGTSEDYACVCFANATHGIAHLQSGQYTALRIGHRSAVCTVAMAPRLQLPVALSGGLREPERVALARTLAFVTVAEGDGSFVTWPRRGPPVRSLPPGAPAAEKEDHHPPCPAALTAAAFHPLAQLSHDGRADGAYTLLGGSADGALHLLVTEGEAAGESGGHDVLPRFRWRTARARPPAPELADLAGGAQCGGSSSSGSTRPPSRCSHIAFTRCGSLAVASFATGLTEVVQLPLLTRALLIQSSSGGSRLGPHRLLPPKAGRGGSPEAPCPKALFVWHPSDEQRSYDSNHYLVSHTSNPQEVVLYEVYPFGEAYAKACRLEFVLPAACQAAGGSVTDFCVHPSQLFLVVGAVMLSAEARSIILVYDMWGGQLLQSAALFTSLLIAPLVPLKPSISVDASGSFIFCASSPVALSPQGVVATATPGGMQLPDWQGPLGGNLMEGRRSAGAAVQDPNAVADASGSSPTAAVVCIVDFLTGLQVYQSSVELSCLVLGSIAQNPTQLFIGAHDGTVSVWHPPEAVSSRIKELLEESKRQFAEGEAIGHFTPAELEEAVASHWANDVRRKLNWQKWGEDVAAEPRGAVGLGGQQGVGALPLPPHQQLVRRRDGLPQAAALPAPPPLPQPPVGAGPSLLQRAGGEIAVLDAAAAGAAAAAAARAGAEDEEDVVVQARRRWFPHGGTVPGPAAASFFGASSATLRPLATTGGAAIPATLGGSAGSVRPLTGAGAPPAPATGASGGGIALPAAAAAAARGAAGAGAEEAAAAMRSTGSSTGQLTGGSLTWPPPPLRPDVLLPAPPEMLQSSKGSMPGALADTLQSSASVPGLGHRSPVPSVRLGPPSPRAAKPLHVEHDPISGLPVEELPMPSEEFGGLGWRRSGPAEAPQRPLAGAPELSEKFGTREEHFQDPVPSSLQQAVDPGLSWRTTPAGGARGALPSASRSPAPSMRSQARLPADAPTVFSDIDTFERLNRDAKALESPRSDAPTEVEQAGRTAPPPTSADPGLDGREGGRDDARPSVISGRVDLQEAGRQREEDPKAPEEDQPGVQQLLEPAESPAEVPAAAQGATAPAAAEHEPTAEEVREEEGPPGDGPPAGGEVPPAAPPAASAEAEEQPPTSGAAADESLTPAAAAQEDGGQEKEGAEEKEPPQQVQPPEEAPLPPAAPVEEAAGAEEATAGATA